MIPSALPAAPMPVADPARAGRRPGFAALVATAAAPAADPASPAEDETATAPTATADDRLTDDAALLAMLAGQAPPPLALVDPNAAARRAPVKAAPAPDILVASDGAQASATDRAPSGPDILVATNGMPVKAAPMLPEVPTGTPAAPPFDPDVLFAGPIEPVSFGPDILIAHPGKPPVRVDVPTILPTPDTKHVDPIGLVPFDPDVLIAHAGKPPVRVDVPTILPSPETKHDGLLPTGGTKADRSAGEPAPTARTNAANIALATDLPPAAPLHARRPAILTVPPQTGGADTTSVAAPPAADVPPARPVPAGQIVAGPVPPARDRDAAPAAARKLLREKIAGVSPRVDIGAAAASTPDAPGIIASATTAPTLPGFDATGSGIAAPSAPATAAHQLDAARHAAWLDGLARDIASTAAPDARLQFAVAPERLGEIRVDLRQTDAGAAVHLTVADPEAHALLVDAQSRLAAEARGQGVRIAETSVGLAPQTASGQPTPSAASPSMSGQTLGGQGGHGGTSHQPAPIVRTAAASPSTTTPRPSRAAAQDRYA